MNLFDGGTGKTLPDGLTWLREPAEWSFDDQGKLTIVPEPRTDFFRPYQGLPNDNACLLYREVSGDFTAVTRTRARLVGFGDAAALTVRGTESRWAKVCLERSPIGDISVVSVVTEDWSDDANGELLATPECFLRLTRKGNLFGMHFSLNGSVWRFIRCFALELPATVMVGVHAQAPFQGGCQAEFESFDWSPQAVGDFRSGE
jgi:regulation of enolase protein 1 (concanavalin A-like superfamily)